VSTVTGQPEELASPTGDDLTLGDLDLDGSTPLFLMVNLLLSYSHAL
jgi:hypothetical protein